MEISIYQNLCNMYANICTENRFCFLPCDWLDLIPPFYHFITVSFKIPTTWSPNIFKQCYPPPLLYSCWSVKLRIQFSWSFIFIFTFKQHSMSTCKQDKDTQIHLVEAENAIWNCKDCYHFSLVALAIIHNVYHLHN